MSLWTDSKQEGVLNFDDSNVILPQSWPEGKIPFTLQGSEGMNILVPNGCDNLSANPSAIQLTVLWLSHHTLEHSLDILPKPVPSDFMVGVPFLVDTSLHRHQRRKSHQIMTDLLIA